MDWKYFDIKTADYLRVVTSNEEPPRGLDHIASIRSGELCFDLMVREDDELDFDLFVGGIDNEYNNTEEGYPYDFVDSVGYTFTASVFKGMDMETFKEFTIEKVNNLIENSKPIVYSGGEYSLLDKANCELKVW